ncbi:hypothetical protein NP493_161g00027 [Ridgeia piscesae]|uniref:Kinesin-like protein n=1 Tax=Ridgeia piscesae TaxID=27915 RepID=A0AAD9P3P1_RIDPI|nr:hypothetical protein NP493_161g00027 [Ridgeia piscesae]
MILNLGCRNVPTATLSQAHTDDLYEVREDEEGGSQINFTVPREASGGIVNNKKEQHKFSFQKVFDQSTKQDEVFELVSKPVVDNVLEGYNGTIFAYGQTGSGKTFTVTGGAERYIDRGIIPRTLSYIFDYYKQNPEFIFSTYISYLEIYNESGYDLLDPKHEAAKLEDLPKVLLMEDSDQNIHLKNLSTQEASNEEEALNLLFLGDTNRMIAETPMNQASTRSHCIFTIHITSREAGSATIKRSKLHLVDLAGSERVSKTGVNGVLLNEAKYINLSLHYLEQVIVALSERTRQHIPYRNSMMTSVLRDSLGGNCMTTMIATCSVERKNIDETMSTCRFAQRVALIKNDAVLNEELDPKLMIVRLKKEVQQLKEELAMATGEQRTDSLSEEDLDRSSKAFTDILVNMLKKEKKKAADAIQQLHTIGLGTPGSHQVALQSASASHTHQVETYNGRHSLSAGDRVNVAAGDVQNARRENDAVEATKVKILGEMSLGRQEAFEIFRRDYIHNQTIDDNKQTLKDRYAEAKRLGEQVNRARKKINKLKSSIEQHRMSRVMQGEVDPNDPDADDLEREMRSQIEDEKVSYKQAFNGLRSLKTEIEHLQHLLERSKVKLMKDFEVWWAEQSAAVEDHRGQLNQLPTVKPAWRTPPPNSHRHSLQQSTDSSLSSITGTVLNSQRGSERSESLSRPNSQLSLQQQQPRHHPSDTSGYRSDGTSKSSRTLSQPGPAAIPLTGDSGG